MQAALAEDGWADASAMAGRKRRPLSGSSRHFSSLGLLSPGNRSSRAISLRATRANRRLSAFFDSSVRNSGGSPRGRRRRPRCATRSATAEGYGPGPLAATLSFGAMAKSCAQQWNCQILQPFPPARAGPATLLRLRGSVRRHRGVLAERRTSAARRLGVGSQVRQRLSGLHAHFERFHPRRRPAAPPQAGTRRPTGPTAMRLPPAHRRLPTGAALNKPAPVRRLHGEWPHGAFTGGQPNTVVANL